MGWNIVAVAAIFINVAVARCLRPYAPTARTISPIIQPTVVDGTVVQSLIDTIQLFIVSDLIEETLPEKQRIYSPTRICDVATPLTVDYDFYDIYDVYCDVEPYPELIFDLECPDFMTALAPLCRSCKPVCEPVACCPRRCVNFGLNEELVLPPLAPELPCGLGYLPGALPVVAKTFAPCSKCCGCGCGSTLCSSAALPVCSPCSCVALATPLCPDRSPLVKPIIL